MVKGLDVFWEHCMGFEDQYVLIGGAACDVLFTNMRGILEQQETLIWY